MDFTSVPGNAAYDFKQQIKDIEDILNTTPSEVAAELIYSRFNGILDFHAENGGISPEVARRHKNNLKQAFETGFYSGMKAMGMNPNSGTAMLFVAYNLMLPAIDPKCSLSRGKKNPLGIKMEKKFRIGG